ncbi:MAG: hypothetical protein HKN47_07365 [Pirellulaceae bacterium]|nr:hypothetical protein [Pirellulaceae bacterium]
MCFQGLHNKTPTCQFAYVTALVGTLLAFAGCNNRVIQATNLPSQYVAPYYPSANQIDLSRLSNDASDSERLAGGDLIGVTISSGLEEKPEIKRVRVNESGEVNVPIVGIVPVAGLTLDEAEKLIGDESIQRRKFVNPVVTVTLEKRRMRKVAVFGAISRPGTYEIPANKCDLAAAIAAAGGLTATADTTVQIRSPKPNQPQVQTVSHEFTDPTQTPLLNQSGESIEIDLTRPEENRREQFELIDGSIVMVREKRPRAVFVTGMVRSPKKVDIPENSDLRLLDAITMAGGRSTPFAQKIKVIRTLDGRAAPISIMTTYSKAKKDGSANLRLAAGDVVSMEETTGLLVFEAIRSVFSFGIGASVPVF